jgi:non-heme chloroperoxidase
MRTTKTNPEIKFIELPGGVKLEYVEQGDAAGVPLMLLHGITDSWHSYERILPLLPASIHAFALSQRGHGDAGKPEGGYRPSDFAADLAAFMDALNIGPAVVAGHSMSSIISRRFAIDYPERVRGLVLIGAFFALRNNPGIPEFWDSVSKLTDPIDPGFVLDFQESTIARPVPQEFLETVVRESLKVPARVWRSALGALIETDLSGETGNIEAPTLICWGDRDVFCPRGDQQALLSAIKGSRLSVYEGTGHTPHWEEPERFAAEMTAFIEALAGRGAAGRQ